MKKSGAQFLRGGAFKPRTSPYSFQGMKAEGLELLSEAKKKTGLPIVTEIMSIEHLPLFEDVDIIQVGARNMQNFELLKQLGRLNKPILLKRGLANTIEELLMSAEYIMAGGNEQVILCERGIRTYETFTRNTLDISAVPVIKKLSHLPVIVDPSHASGINWLIEPLALAAAAIGADGLIIEVHNDPSHALCDGAQSITPAQFDALAQKVTQVSRPGAQPCEELPWRSSLWAWALSAALWPRPSSRNTAHRVLGMDCGRRRPAGTPAPAAPSTARPPSPTWSARTCGVPRPSTPRTSWPSSGGYGGQAQARDASSPTPAASKQAICRAMEVALPGRPLPLCGGPPHGRQGAERLLPPADPSIFAGASYILVPGQASQPRRWNRGGGPGPADGLWPGGASHPPGARPEHRLQPPRCPTRLACAYVLTPRCRSAPGLFRRAATGTSPGWPTSTTPSGAACSSRQPPVPGGGAGRASSATWRPIRHAVDAGRRGARCGGLLQAAAQSQAGSGLRPLGDTFQNRRMYPYEAGRSRPRGPTACTS